MRAAPAVTVRTKEMRRRHRAACARSRPPRRRLRSRDGSAGRRPPSVPPRGATSISHSGRVSGSGVAMSDPHQRSSSRRSRSGGAVRMCSRRSGAASTQTCRRPRGAATRRSAGRPSMRRRTACRRASRSSVPSPPMKPPGDRIPAARKTFTWPGRSITMLASSTGARGSPAGAPFMRRRDRGDRAEGVPEVSSRVRFRGVPPRAVCATMTTTRGSKVPASRRGATCRTPGRPGVP